MFNRRYVGLIFSIVIVMITASLCSGAEDDQKIEHETGLYYNIQKGDTLWKLSERFFDTPLKWPDLWKENSQIANPHWIYPGNRIRLFHEEGRLQLKEPEPEKEEPKTAEQMEEKKEPPYFLFNEIDRVGFVREKPLPPIGVIFRVESAAQLIYTGDTVYINKREKQPLTPGSKFTVYRTVNLIKDLRTKSFRGHQHFLTGVVEITKDEPRFAVAKVITSYRSILIDDRVMPYQKRSPKIPLQENKKEITGQIIVSEEPQMLFGNSTIAFIDKGNRHGIAPGQMYSLYYQEKNRLNPRDKKDTPLPPVDIGTFLVLCTEETTAAVFITQASKSVSSGARFHVPLP